MGLRLQDNPVSGRTTQRAAQSPWLACWLALPALFSCAAGICAAVGPFWATTVLGWLIPPRQPLTVYGASSDSIPAVAYLYFSSLVLFVGSATIAAVPLAAGAIARERQAGTLEALRLTRMGTGAIVWGKLAGALWLPLRIDLAGLPVLLLGMLFGGVTYAAVAALFATVVLMTASFGTLSLAVSAWCRKAPTATAISYALCGALTLGTLLPAAAAGRFGLLRVPPMDWIPMLSPLVLLGDAATAGQQVAFTPRFLTVGIAGHTLLAAASLWMAVRGVNRR